MANNIVEPVEFKEGNYYQEKGGIVVKCTNPKGLYYNTFTGVVVVENRSWRLGHYSNTWIRECFEVYERVKTPIKDRLLIKCQICGNSKLVYEKMSRDTFSSTILSYNSVSGSDSKIYIKCNICGTNTLLDTVIPRQDKIKPRSIVKRLFSIIKKKSNS